MIKVNLYTSAMNQGNVLHIMVQLLSFATFAEIIQIVIKVIISARMHTKVVTMIAAKIALKVN